MNANYRSDDDNSALKSKKIRLIGILLATLIVVGLLATSVDCDGEEGSGDMQVMEVTGRPGLTSFNKAMDLLEGLSEYESGQAEVTILRNLQAWLRDSDPVVEWVADPMVSRLPKKYQMVSNVDLSRKSIGHFDVQVLREASWLRDVVQTVLRVNATSPDIAKITAETKSVVDAEVANDLDSALRLFDWVVRNIQTDALVEAGSTERYGSDAILAAWRNLLYGHGTTLEKSRLFMLLCRQAGIETVMLGIDQDQGDPREWMPAVYLNNELYLFEMEFGVPVLSKSANRIAKLTDVLDDPTAFAAFDLDGEDYRSKYNFSKIVAMIDATPAYLSQRMKMIEKSMTGNNRMVLTVTPSPLSKRLRRTKGITRTEIWTFPYEMYRRVQTMSPERQQVMQRELAREQNLFDIRRNSFSSDSSGFTKQYAERTRNIDARVSLIQGRLLHLKGRYSNDDSDETRGSLSHYFEIRPTDSELENLTRVEPANLKPEDAKAFRESVALYRHILSTTKENATYWTGLVAFDKGDYKVAIDWFVERYLNRTIDKKWLAGAHYNSGRAYEALADDQSISDSERADLLSKARAAYEAGAATSQAAVANFRLKQLDGRSTD